MLGLSICIYPSGGRSFMFDYRAAGRQRRLTIGRWPEWNVTAAREARKALRRDVDGGLDPLAEREEIREAPRFPDLVARYLREHAAHLAPRNAADQASMLHKLIMPHWKHRLVAEIEPADVERVLNLIAEGVRAQPRRKAKDQAPHPLKPPKPTPVRANRAGEMLRRVFNLAIAWRMRPTIRRWAFAAASRPSASGFLDMEEIARLSEALERGRGPARRQHHPHVHADRGAAGRGPDRALRAFRSGAQHMGEARRQYQAAPHSPRARSRQRQRHWCARGFPPCRSAATGCFRAMSRARTSRCREIRRFWKGIQDQAGLPGVRVHDLRHTFASLLVSGGASLEMIGKAAGAIRNPAPPCAMRI